MFKTKYLKLRVACLGSLLVAACTSVPPQPEFSAPHGTVSPSRIESHLSNLGEIVARNSPSEAPGVTREYLGEALSEAGAELTRHADDGREHLEARLPGRNPGEIIVLVPLPTPGAPTWIDDSGVVLGLELVRVSAERELEYSLAVLFAEVRSNQQHAPEGDEASLEEGAVAARKAVAVAGESLLKALGSAGAERLANARAVLVLEPQAYQPIQIARDLPSHPVFRTLFWETAASLGHSALFPRESAWASPAGLQTALHGAEVGRLLAIVDATTVLTDVSNEGPAPRVADPSVAAMRLGPLLEVVSEGIERLMVQFERIDAFSE